MPPKRPQSVHSLTIYEYLNSISPARFNFNRRRKKSQIPQKLCWTGTDSVLDFGEYNKSLLPSSWLPSSPSLPPCGNTISAQWFFNSEIPSRNSFLCTGLQYPEKSTRQCNYTVFMGLSIQMLFFSGFCISNKKPGIGIVYRQEHTNNEFN